MEKIGGGGVVSQLEGSLPPLGGKDPKAVKNITVRWAV